MLQKDNQAQGNIKNADTKFTETDTFSSIVTGKTFLINHELNCDNQCLIYTLTCEVCKRQYVEETNDSFWVMTENFREMKATCNSIFMGIFTGKTATDSREMSLWVLLTKLMVFNLRKEKFTRGEP